MTVVVLDDVIEEDQFNILSKDLVELFNGLTLWEEWYNLDTHHPCQSVCSFIIDKARDYYDLTSCTGYEFWVHNNTRPPEWHQDKDERMLKEKGIYSFPLCSIVYYACVENLKGGNIEIEDGIVVSPKSNRMVIFTGSKFHYVQEYTGTRLSLIINPWDGSKYLYPDPNIKTGCND